MRFEERYDTSIYVYKDGQESFLFDSSIKYYINRIRVPEWLYDFFYKRISKKQNPFDLTHDFN